MGCSWVTNGSLWSLPRSYIYQKRWVKLDSDYLRYFDSEKVRIWGSQRSRDVPLGIMALRWGRAKGQHPQSCSGWVVG